jgi:hypothetical protein
MCDKDSSLSGGESPVIDVSVLTSEGLPFEGTCRYRFTDEDSRSIEEGDLPFHGGNARYTMKTEKPGFLRLFVTVPYAKGAWTDLVTIGVEPQRIEISQTLPDDFMEFWLKQKARLDAIPPDIHRVEFDGPDPEFHYEYVDFRNVEGKRFYCADAAKAPGKYPVQMGIPGRDLNGMSRSPLPQDDLRRRAS